MYDFKRLSLILSAIAVTGAVAGSADAMSRAALTEIHDYVESRDAAGLRSYLEANPDLLESSPLADEFADFLGEPPRQGLLVWLGLASPIPSSLSSEVEAAAQANSIY